jgi:hypothetical protein
LQAVVVRPSGQKFAQEGLPVSGEHANPLLTEYEENEEEEEEAGHCTMEKSFIFRRYSVVAGTLVTVAMFWAGEKHMLTLKMSVNEADSFAAREKPCALPLLQSMT